tara:strand:- start:2029 stop:3423 length:1395 start_codon:yes stop_codon:yes gene_type:complete
MFRQHIAEKAFALFKKKKSLYEIRSVAATFDIGRELGKGAFGIVFQGLERTTGRKVAIKEIKYTEKHDIIDKEVIFLAQMHHENIAEMVRAFRPSKKSDMVYIAMELCTGGELFDAIIQHSYLTEGIARQVTYEILSAIEYCHARRIAHLDLKPENIILASPWKGPGQTFPPVKLIDWGLASSFEDFETCPCMIKGTPTYVAPEVLQRHYDQRADIWSIGVIVYVMISGDVPFYGETTGDLFENIQTAEPSYNADDGWDKVSDNCKSFIQRLLAKSPTMRPIATGALNLEWLQTTVDTVRPETSLVRLRRYTHQNKLKRVILFDFAQRSSPKSVKRAAAIFKKMSGGDDRISLNNLRKGLLEFLGQSYIADIPDIVIGLDLNNDRHVDVNEFIVAMMAPHYTTRFRLQRFFLNSNVESTLTLHGLIRFFGSRSKAKKIFRRIDTDKDGVISMREFVDWFLKDEH